MRAEVRPMREEDREALVALHRQAFNYPPGPLERFRAAPVGEQLVVADERGRVLGGLHVEPVAQLFGGRAIPTAAVSAVKIAPEARGGGLGGVLLREMLRAQRAAGVPLSLLYPSAPSTYRRSGYELAGAHVRYSAPTTFTVERGALPAERWDDTDLGEVQACYRRFADGHNGLLERTDAWWRARTLGEWDGPIYRYLVRAEGRVVGYVVYTLEQASGDLPYFHTLRCRDLVWETPAAAQALLAFAGAHRLLATHLRWTGPVADPLFLLVDGGEVRAEWSYVWMSRLVDVRGALEARGYAPWAEGAVELAVDDPTLPENGGAFRLEVAGGSATVAELGAARLRLSVSTLAGLFTGWLPARTAARAGLLPGATEAELDQLDRIFAGPTPWLLEMF